MAAGDFLAQLAVGGADQRNVDLDVARAAQRRHAAFLQHAQQAGLQVERHVADFIEEQGAAVRLLDLAGGPFLAGAGKGTALVTEELRLDQGFRNGGAVQRNEGRVAARAAVVEGLGQHFLAGAGFALDQDRDVAAEQAARPVDDGLQSGVAGVQGVEGQARGAAGFRAAGRAGGRHLVEDAAGNGQRRQLAAQLDMDGLAVNVDFTACLRVMAQAVDERGQVALENHREIAAHGIDRANAEEFGAIAVDGQHLSIRTHGGHALLGAAQVIGTAVKADQDVAAMRRFEQALFHDGRRQAGQAQRVALVAAVVAGNVEHADQPAIRPEDRTGAAGQEAVVFEEVLAAEHGDRHFFAQGGADGVGAAQVLVPRGAGRQGNAISPADEIGIADGFQQQAVGVGQDDHAARVANLLENMLHDRPALLEQVAVALLFRFQGHAIHRLQARGGAVFAQPEAPAALPGADDQRVEQAFRGRALGKEQLPGLLQPLAVGLDALNLSHVSSGFSRFFCAVAERNTCSVYRQRST